MENFVVTVDEGAVNTNGNQDSADSDLKRQDKAGTACMHRGGSCNPDQAKKLVFEHWKQLDRQCKRRFPQNENLAHEALLFVLKHLEVNEWQRIRTWKGSGRFQTFLTTLASRLLTDYTRKKFGYIRMPKWLTDKKDPIWSAAYRLLMVEQNQRHEVVNLLQTNQPSRERWFLEEVVSTIQTRCHACASESNVPIEHCKEPESSHSAPEIELSIHDGEILEALGMFLDVRNQADTPNPTERIKEIVTRLKPHMELTEEDCMLLRLRYVNGIKMKEIVRLLNFKGDPYKRYHKIFRSLRSAFQKAGLLDVLWID